jgi:hypothetical protein
MDINVQDLLETAGKIAGKEFHGHPDVYDMVTDVQHLAWEFSLTAGDRATIKSLIGYAIRRVLVRRQFKESARCLETIPKQKSAKRHEFRRVAFDLRAVANDRDNPAEIAALRIDFPAWLQSLPPWKREVAKRLAVGEKPGAVANQLNLHPSQVSKLQRELKASWEKAHS